jgi:hypothetical protein
LLLVWLLIIQGHTGRVLRDSSHLVSPSATSLVLITTSASLIESLISTASLILLTTMMMTICGGSPFYFPLLSFFLAALTHDFIESSLSLELLLFLECSFGLLLFFIIRVFLLLCGYFLIINVTRITSFLLHDCW